MIAKHIKFYPVIVAAFALPLFGLAVLSRSALSGVAYRNYLIHSILLVVMCAIAFYASYLAYKAYLKNRDVRIFVTSLAFCIFGASFFIHAISVPDWHFFNEEIFDVTEHYGLFIGAMIFFCFMMPIFDWRDKIYKKRLSIVFGTALVLLAGFISLFFSRSLADFLAGFVNFITIFSAFLFFGIVIALLKIYREAKSGVLIHLASGFNILAVATLVPFFYQEWDVLWWYFHILCLLGFIVILVGIIKTEQNYNSLEVAFGKAPIYSKISTKMILLVLSLSLIPLLSINYFIFRNFENNLEAQVFKDLTSMSKSIEGQIWAYLDSVKSRTVDFSSDGFIRDKLKEVIETRSARSVEELNGHLINNKKILDQTILNILVIDSDGIVVSGTDAGEIGKNESDDEYFKAGRNGVYVAELALSEKHFSLKERALVVAHPVTDKISGARIGVLVNYFSLEKIQTILSSGFQFGADAGSSKANWPRGAQVYVIDKQKILFVKSEKDNSGDFEADDSSRIVDIAPVNECLGRSREMAGVYANYKGEEVLGASVCVKERGWVILLEMNKQDVFQSITDLETSMITIIPITVMLVIFAGIYFAGRLTKPVESLTAVTKKIIGGNLNIRAQAISNDEVGVLADNFNRMTDALVEAKKFPENIIRSMNDSLIVVSVDAAIKEVNEATLKLLNYNREELVGRPFSIIINKGAADIAAGGKMIDRIKNDGLIKDTELSYFTKDGGEIPVSISGTAMKNESGGLIGIVMVAKDMRAIKELEHAKSEFVSIAAHQMRTPLSIIKWTFQMMLDGDFGRINSDQKKALVDGDMINERMINLISDLLNVSRIEEEKFILKTSLSDIAEVIISVISTIKPKADKKKVRVIFKKPDDLPKMNMDAGKIYLALENIIDNALKYAQGGGLVLIDARKRDNYVEITIADNGIGIPADQQNKIFDRFFRSRNAKLKETEGSGLGLYIAKSIVEKHGGKVWFESPISETTKQKLKVAAPRRTKADFGPGTVFYILLPI